MPYARKGRQRRSKGYRRNFVAIPFFVDLALGTLVDNIVVKTPVLTFGEDLFAISYDVVCAIQGQTAGQGPLIVGMAHGDLSTTEIAEAIDAEVTDPDDIIAKERARRPVRRLGVFPGLSSEEALAQGQIQRRSLRMSIGDGHSFDVWAVNRSGGNLAGGAIMSFSGTIFGRWQR